MSKIFTGDWHCGLVLGGISRHNEIQTALNEMISKSYDLSSKPSDVIIMGDLTEYPRVPGNDVYAQILDVLKSFRSAKNIIIIKGNHDWDGLYWYSLALDNVTYISKPQNVQLSDGSYLSCIPNMRNFELQNGGYGAVIDQLAAELPDNCEKILAAHAAVSNTTRLHEDTIPAEKIDEHGYDFAFFGHVHQHMKIRDAKGNKYYTGALIRNTFGETKENDVSGVWVLDKGRVSNIPLTTPLVLKNFKISTLEDLNDIKSRENIKSGLFKVKIKDGSSLTPSMCRDYGETIGLGYNFFFDNDRQDEEEDFTTSAVAGVPGAKIGASDFNVSDLWDKFCETSGYGDEVKRIGEDVFAGEAPEKIWENFGAANQPEPEELER